MSKRRHYLDPSKHDKGQRRWGVSHKQEKGERSYAWQASKDADKRESVDGEG